MISKHLSCPDCNGSLVITQTVIKCRECDFDGACHEGIFDFRAPAQRVGAKSAFARALSSFDTFKVTDRWTRVVQSVVNGTLNGEVSASDIVTDGSYAWQLFLSLPKDAVMLDLGSGLGSLIKKLAPQVGTAYGIDTNWDHVKFSKIRCDELNPTNEISFIAANNRQYLPFTTNSLDCVTLSEQTVLANRRLDDCGAGESLSERGSSIRFVPRNRLLDEIRRILKPQGQLFIVVTNRINPENINSTFSASSFFRDRTHVSRVFSSVISAIGRPDIDSTTTIGSYKRLLTRAGYSEFRTIGLLKSHGELNEITNISVPEIDWSAAKQKSFRAKLKYHPALVPMYGFLASEQVSQHPVLLEAIVKELLPRLPGDKMHGLVIRQLIVSGKDKVIIIFFRGSFEGVLKIAFSDVSSTSEKNGAKILKQIALNPTLASITPEPITQGTFRGFRYFVETRVLGDNLKKHLTVENRESFVAPVYKLWQRVSAVDDHRNSFVLDEETFNDLTRQNYTTIRSFTRHPEILDAVLRTMRDNLIGRTLTLGLQHGDFGLNNILVTPDRTLKLIDWETASMRGLVALDIINYLDSAERIIGTQRLVSGTLRLLLSGNWPHAVESTMLDEAISWSGLDPHKHRFFLVVIYWMKHISEQLKGAMQYDSVAIEERLNDFLALDIGQFVNR